jgi:putative flippase GtrA
MHYFPVPATPFYRWIVFNSVGAMGFVLQIGTLFLLVHAAGLHYLPATALAVEIAVLHNFIWHENWTWVDRTGRKKNGRCRRLFHFHLANGVISILGNLLLMRFLVGVLEMHYLPANLFAIALCAVLNFLAGDRLVFRSNQDRP